MILTKKQTTALDYLEDRTTGEVLFGGAAGGGKSGLGCYWQLKRRLRFEGSRGFIGRAKFNILLETTLKTFFEIAAKQGLKRGSQFDLTGPWDKENKNCIVFSNGSLIYLRDLFHYPSDPDFDDLGSLEVTDVFIDECGQVVYKAKETLLTRIRFGLNAYCDICGSKIKSTVLAVDINGEPSEWICEQGHITKGLIPKALYATNPVKTWPYQEFYRPDKQIELPQTRKIVRALAVDNPHVSQSYVVSLRNMTEGPQKERLLRGNWEYTEDDTALIEYEKILDCFTNTWIAVSGRAFITCDVARFGSDKTVIGVWNGWGVRLYAYHGLSVSQTAEKVKEYQNKFRVGNSDTIADEDGVGGGVVDILKCRGFVNNSRPIELPGRELENFSNLKSQCYFHLAERINKGGVFIDCNDPEMKATIIEELEQVKQYNMDKDGKRAVLPKDKVKEVIGRSPDFSDTIMMREWFDLTPSMSWVAF